MLNQIKTHSSYAPLEKLPYLKWLEKHNVSTFVESNQKQYNPLEETKEYQNNLIIKFCFQFANFGRRIKGFN